MGEAVDLGGVHVVDDREKEGGDQVEDGSVAKL